MYTHVTLINKSIKKISKILILVHEAKNLEKMLLVYWKKILMHNRVRICMLSEQFPVCKWLTLSGPMFNLSRQ